ncbi:MAG: glycosyltransferase family 39 protein [Cyclobacteriaceae bacterium]|nr:glycosyltransferase family 39 protein [Cyclobacteriaceae bacterium HetDA_MAG_MS6]
MRLKEPFFLIYLIVALLLILQSSLSSSNGISPDSMNYIEIARNHFKDLGLVKSSIGFNEASFPSDYRLDHKQPMFSQPPLYPLMISFFMKIGLSGTSSSLIISWIALLFTLSFCWLIARKFYSLEAAFLVTALLLNYYPLRLISGYAWTEGLALCLILGSIWFLVSEKIFCKYFFSGMLGGLAFSARYSMVFLVLVFLIFIFTKKYPLKQKLKSTIVWGIGFSIPFVLVLGRNFYHNAALLPVANPSEVSLFENSITYFKTLFSSLISGDFSLIQLAFFLLFIITVVLADFLSKVSIKDKIFKILISGDRVIIPLMIVVYTIFLLYQRTVRHFDPLDERFIVLSGLMGLMLISAYLTLQLKSKLGFRIVLFGLVTFSISQNVLAISRASEDSEQSARIMWIDKNTTSSDLIIGDNTADIPYLLNRDFSVSFSPYPYTNHVSRSDLNSIVCNNSDLYENFYLVVRKRYSSQVDWERYFGSYISEIIRTSDHQDISLLAELEDAYIFKLQCL